MSNYPGLFNEIPETKQLDRLHSPSRLLAMLVLIIFLADMIAMAILDIVDIPNYMVASLLDGLIMMALILPGLYYLQLNPLIKHIQVRNKTESALRESEVLLRNVLELIPVGVRITDQHGKILHVNPASHQIWSGASNVDIDQYGEYKGWWADTGKRIEPEEWAATRAIKHGETSLNEEVEIECLDGTHKIILNSALPILDKQNAIQGAIIVNQDITNRRQAENELIRTNELLEKFFSSIDTLIAYMDRDFNFIRINEAYAKSAGHPIDFFAGKNHFELYPHDENRAIFSRVVETGEPFSVSEKPFEYPEYPDRGVTYWDWSLQPVKEADGFVRGLVLSLVEVTERKRAEDQLELQNRELRELSHLEHRQRELAESLVQSTIVLNSSLNLQDVLNTILEQIRRSIAYQGANIVMLEGGSIYVAGYLGFEDHPEGMMIMGGTYSTIDFPLFQKVCSSLQPVRIADTHVDPEWQVVPGMEWVRSYLAAPLVVEGEVTGILNLNSDQPDAFDETTVERLIAFTGHAALALRNARLYQAESAARQTAETLSAAAQALTQILEVDHVIHTLLEHINKVIPSDTSGVGLLEDEMNLVTRVVRGSEQWKSPTGVSSATMNIGSNLMLQELITTRKSLLIADITTYPKPELQIGIEGFRAWLVTPIIAGDKVIGVVGLGKREAGFFTEGHVRWAEALVGQAAVAIQNSWLFEEIRSSRERLQSLARKLVDIQEKERYSISRELHDEAGQTLSTLKLGIGQLEQNPDCPEVVRERLQDLKRMADGVLEELRRIAKDLRPASLDHLGLVPAIKQLANSLNSKGLSVQFKAVGFEDVRIPPAMETALYRIVQEATTNVLRHSCAKNVGILLERRAGNVQVFVEDDGIGFDHDLVVKGSSLGLVGMRERAEMLGGTLTVESTPGLGTTVKVEVPDVDTNSNRR